MVLSHEAFVERADEYAARWGLVVRALGFTTQTRIRLDPKYNWGESLSRMISDPQIAVASSPEEDPHDRDHVLLIGAPYVKATNGLFFRVTTITKQPMADGDPDVARRLVELTTMTGHDQPLDQINTVKYLDGVPGSLTFNGMPTHPREMAPVLTRVLW